MPKTPVSFEQLLVRHTNASRRKVISYVEKQLKVPFESFGSGGCGSDDESTFDIDKAPMHCPLDKQCVAIARFRKEEWLPVSANGASLEEIVNVNDSARLDLAWLGHDADKGLWFLRMSRGGKFTFKFSFESQTDKIVVDGEASARTAIKGITDGLKALAALRTHFELPDTLRRLQLSERQFVVIDESGKKVSQKVCGFWLITGPKILPMGTFASPELAKAIEKCDAKGIEKAIAKGASLLQLPETSSSPLVTASFNCERPNGEQCFELLLKHGAAIGNLVAESVAHYIPASLSLKILKVLLRNGGDVNAVSDMWGQTALMTAVANNEFEIAKLLMEHDADPTIVTQVTGLSPIGWLEREFHKEGGASKKAGIARLLELLTGTAVSLPETVRLSDEFKTENERFRFGLTAVSLVNSSPEAKHLHPLKKVSSDIKAKFRAGSEELQSLGFESVGYFQQLNFRKDFSADDRVSARDIVNALSTAITTAAFSNRELSMNALLEIEADGSDVGCTITASSNDGRLLRTTNVERAGDFDSAAATLVREFHSGESPKKLVSLMQKLIKKSKVKLLPASPDRFVEGYNDASRKILEDLQRQARDILATPKVFHDGQPARFERLQSFLDFSSWDDPGRTSRTMWDEAMKHFGDAVTDANQECWSAESVIREAFFLLAMQHFQFCGAAKDHDYLAKACRIGGALFEKLSGKWKKELNYTTLNEFEQILLMCQVTGDDKNFKKVCAFVPPAIAASRLRDSSCPPLPYAQLWMVIASEFRPEPIPRVKSLEKEVAGSRSKRSKFLLSAWKAIAAKDAPTFSSSIADSLKEFDEHPDPNRMPDFRGQIAIAESVLCNLAKQRGIEVDLPIELRDRMILVDEAAR